jgi:hypothetical protein
VKNVQHVALAKVQGRIIYEKAGNWFGKKADPHLTVLSVSAGTFHTKVALSIPHSEAADKYGKQYC